MAASRRFLCVLACAAALALPSPVAAEKTNTDCAAVAASAETAGRIAREVLHEAGTINAVGSESAAHLQGQAGAAFRSALQHTDDSLRAALANMHDALASVQGLCPSYSPPGDLERQMDFKLRSSGTQAWNFAAIESATSALRAAASKLAALADDFRDVQADLGPARRRAVEHLMDAQASLRHMESILADAGRAMESTERDVTGMFSKGAPKPKPTKAPI